MRKKVRVFGISQAGFILTDQLDRRVLWCKSDDLLGMLLMSDSVFVPKVPIKLKIEMRGHTRISGHTVRDHNIC